MVSNLQRKTEEAEAEAAQEAADEAEAEVAPAPEVASSDSASEDAISARAEAASPSKPANSTENSESQRTVYVAGIPYSCSEDDIWELFEKCGVIEDLRMPRYHDSGNIRGYAHVDFATAEACAKALQLDGHVIKGRYLAVKVANVRGNNPAKARAAPSELVRKAQNALCWQCSIRNRGRGHARGI